MEGTACLTGARTAWTASKIWLLFLIPYNCLLGLNHLGPDKGHSNLSFTVYYLLTTRFRELNEPLSPIYRWLFLLLHRRKSEKSFMTCPGAPPNLKMFMCFIDLWIAYIFEYEWAWNMFTLYGYMLYRDELRGVSVRLITLSSDWQIYLLASLSCSLYANCLYASWIAEDDAWK